MTNRVLIDTGPLVALFSQNDQHYQLCSDALIFLTPPLLTCWPVITEAAWMLRKYPNGLPRLFESFHGGLFALLPLDADDLPAIAAMMKRYADTGVQLADAALAHLAERENIRTIFTLDRRDFSIIRLKRNRTLKLVPEVR